MKYHFKRGVLSWATSWDCWAQCCSKLVAPPVLSLLVGIRLNCSEARSHSLVSGPSRSRSITHVCLKRRFVTHILRINATLWLELRASLVEGKNKQQQEVNHIDKPAKQPAGSATVGFSFFGFSPSQHQWKFDYLADQRSLHQLQNCLCCLTLRRLHQGSSHCSFSFVQCSLQAKHQLLFANQQVQIPIKK